MIHSPILIFNLDALKFSSCFARLWMCARNYETFSLLRAKVQIKIEISCIQREDGRLSNGGCSLVSLKISAETHFVIIQELFSHICETIFAYAACDAVEKSIFHSCAHRNGELRERHRKKSNEMENGKFKYHSVGGKATRKIC